MEDASDRTRFLESGEDQNERDADQKNSDNTVLCLGIYQMTCFVFFFLGHSFYSISIAETGRK